MSWRGMDTRRGIRVAFECVVIVKKKETSVVFRTQTENLSVGGVYVILQKGLLKNTPVEIELFLPDYPVPITCSGKVAWSIRRNEYTKRKPMYFDTGLEFIDITQEDKSRLRRIIEDLVQY